MRKAITALMMTLLFVPSAFGLSDKEYRSMMNDSEFRVAIRTEYINGLTSSRQKSAANASDSDMADKLVGEGKIPMYVRDKGKFVYNHEFDIVGINGINVNLRSQPNVNSTVIIQLSKDDPDKWPAYLCEWTHPSGDYWVAGEIKHNGKSQSVWIFGRYAEPMTKETFAQAKDSTNDDFDLPDDDLPGDLPDLPDEPSPKKPQPKKAAVSSQEQAQEIITEKLFELDEITPTETLDAAGTAEIDGATCWEFTSPVSYTQYAISPDGKIYVHDGEKYSPVK